MPEGETALMTAARTGNVDSIKLLVETGAKIDARENWQGQTRADVGGVAEQRRGGQDARLELGADKNERSKLLSFPGVQVGNVGDGGHGAAARRLDAADVRGARRRAPMPSPRWPTSRPT